MCPLLIYAAIAETYLEQELQTLCLLQLCRLDPEHREPRQRSCHMGSLAVGQ